MTVSSPFPGLDPYLERYWGDVHHRLTLYSSDALQVSLPRDLLARVEERVFVECDNVRIRNIVPDAHVVERHPPVGGGVAVAPDVETAEPRVFLFEPEEITEGFIEIREGDGGRVVTVIEFLSPANKAGGEGTRQYLQKQNEILHSDTSLVEIDLVRGGRRVLSLPTHMIPADYRDHALTCIHRAWRPRGERELYSFPLRQRLKSLPIPLRPSDPPVLLHLQAILDQCYRNGRYDSTDYARAPEPPLTAEDAAWAEELLRATGKRAATA